MQDNQPRNRKSKTVQCGCQKYLFLLNYVYTTKLIERNMFFHISLIYFIFIHVENSQSSLKMQEVYQWLHHMRQNTYCTIWASTKQVFAGTDALMETSSQTGNWQEYKHVAMVIETQICKWTVTINQIHRCADFCRYMQNILMAYDLHLISVVK